MEADGCYSLGFAITWVIAFIAGIAYAVGEWGWFLGIGVGWLPAGVVAVVVALLWPLLVLVLFGLFLLIYFGG